MKRVILCADDYGQTSAISQAILALIKLKRLTAVSCMVTSLNWVAHAKELKPYMLDIDVGLHFNLTENSFFSLSELLMKSHLRWINKNKIYIELEKQLDIFIETMGKLPDFIDGHQHIHQFPIIRDVLFEVYNKRLRQQGCYVRSVYGINDWQGLNHRARIKMILIQLSGAVSFTKSLKKYQIPHNKSFSGVYSFDEGGDYDKWFNLFLKNIKHGGLIMCHPGLTDNESRDPIKYSRMFEHSFLCSESFLASLEKNNIQLSRFKEIS